MQEIFTFIDGYMYPYTVSNTGRVFNGMTELKQSNVCGYKVVALKQTNGKFKQQRVHRLVAQAFIPNPDNLPQVNHKDEDKTNNCVDNLEWCTADYNNKYGTRLQRVSNSLMGHKIDENTKKKIRDTTTRKQGVAVDLYDKSGNLIATYPSTKEAERQTGFDHSKISSRCKGRVSCKNEDFIWKYHNKS